MTVDANMAVAICEHCKNARQSYADRPFCETCGTRHIMGTVLFELEDRVVRRLVFTPGLGESEQAETPSMTGIKCGDCGYLFGVAQELERYTCPKCGVELESEKSDRAAVE